MGMMLIHYILYLLLSNAVTSRRDKSILHSRTTIISLVLASRLIYIISDLSLLGKGVGLFACLFHVSTIRAALSECYVLITIVAIYSRVLRAVYYLGIVKQIFFDLNYVLITCRGLQAIAVLTLIISLFMFSPQEWISLINILALILYN